MAKRYFTLAVVVLLLTMGAVAQSGHPAGTDCSGSICELRWPTSEGSGGISTPLNGVGQSIQASNGSLDSLISSNIDFNSTVSLPVFPSSPNFNLGSDAGPITLVSPYQLPGGNFAGGGASAIVGRLQTGGWTGGVGNTGSLRNMIRYEFPIYWNEYGPLIAMGPMGGGGGSIYNNKIFYTGEFHDSLSLWEMQDFGSKWGINANIPGRHLLGKLDVLVTNSKYAAAVARVAERFWQQGLAIQNAIANEPKLMEVFNAAAETDADFRIVEGETAAEREIIYKHYQRTGLKAFDNP
jgi:hypothetical protein